MANTYTQLYVQFVFTVKGRKNMIDEQFREELEKVICGIISNHKSKTYAVYCNPDHTHVFVGIHPIISPSKLMEQVKSGSSKWLNDKRYLSEKFHWQEGFGAFTYSRSHIDTVVKYILNQPKHHKKVLFREEYISFLVKFGIDFDSKYLFEWYD
jgi:REP element-mobilizing transposase RayT